VRRELSTLVALFFVPVSIDREYASLVATNLLAKPQIVKEGLVLTICPFIVVTLHLKRCHVWHPKKTQKTGGITYFM
jgi:hypothetical protein